MARGTSGVVAADALELLSGFADAYRIQEAVGVELGWTRAGWKVAAPPAGEVMSAPIFDRACAGSGAVFDDTTLMRDGVECELAVRIDHPLPAGGCTRDDVLAAVGAVMPAFELLCSRLPAKFVSPREHIVADGMGNGAVVLGAPCEDARSLDLASLRMTLSVDDTPVVDKQGGNPFSDPLLAVVHLVNHLALRGERLAAGSFVLAGSHAGVHRAQAGQRLRCVFEGIGAVELSVRDSAAASFKEQDHVGR
ncbi:2-keto-4-pentenoate hydratase [Variovorax sp. ZT4R33]|uniref:2-keto-4-pentenoate hydratase n=1 Tax=Variovorax sp. ZT4R33 TaxID=3443743 RepID=UPI003F48D54E